MSAMEVEISEDMFVIKKEVAEAYLKRQERPAAEEQPRPPGPPEPGPRPPVPPTPPDARVRRIEWTGEVPPQKWMNFYTKFLTKFVGEKGLRLTIKVEVSRGDGIPDHKIEEAKVALQELGLDSDVSIGG
jgi:hypothetical protein